jgi:hypothetical protein
MPIFQLSRNESGVAQLTIELRYAPEVFPDRLRELRKIIQLRLMKQCPELQSLIERGLLYTQFQEPGHLGSDREFRP